MLRVNLVTETPETVVVRLEGKLLAVWVEEVQNAIQLARQGSGRVEVDLSALSFADDAGLALLRDLQNSQVPLILSSGYVAACLRQVKS